MAQVVTPQGHGLGWHKDPIDQRDLAYIPPLAMLHTLPPLVDLRPQCPPVYDQGALGSCTANAIGAAYQFMQMKAGGPSYLPSRLFIYYNERVLEGTVTEDAGAYIRDGFKVLKAAGAPPETDWPYDISKFAEKAPNAVYYVGVLHQAVQYLRVSRTLVSMKTCLAAGYPFVLGFTVYESFESAVVAQTGIMPLPEPGEQVLGGHAVLAVGYDNAAQQFIVRNSWGMWGLDGYFLMPMSFLLNPQWASDFWTLKKIEG